MRRPSHIDESRGPGDGGTQGKGVAVFTVEVGRRWKWKMEGYLVDAAMIGRGIAESGPSQNVNSRSSSLLPP